MKGFMLYVFCEQLELCSMGGFIGRCLVDGVFC